MAYVLSVAVLLGILATDANAASCATQSQMSTEQRDALSSAARSVMGHVQTGDTEAIRADTIPAVAADFAGIATSVTNLKALVERATLTVDALYLLDASTDSAAAGHVDFYCGSPVVVLNFTSLPAGNYALAILHATGVDHPQQVSLILAKTVENQNHWLLAGFFSKPMTEAGHDGLWYWSSARQYAQQKMRLNAWLYYRLASDLLDPVDFLSSPNLQKLQHEAEQIQPESLPETSPVTLTADGGSFHLVSVATTSDFGGLDLEVHYTPDAEQASQLKDASAARKQVVAIMTGLLTQHPELQAAFHGVWVRADQGDASLFALELPMEAILASTQSSVPRTGSVLR